MNYKKNKFRFFGKVKTNSFIGLDVTKSGRKNEKNERIYLRSVYINHSKLMEALIAQLEILIIIKMPSFRFESTLSIGFKTSYWKHVSAIKYL